jgi:hypothetical protein
MNEENNERSLVTVIFHDGEAKEYVLAAGHGISSYLAKEAGRDGILYMRGPDECYSIPVRVIREWKVAPLPDAAPGT